MSSSYKNIPIDEFMPLVEESLARGQKVTFSPQGVSMLPMIRQGVDSVTLSPIEGPLKKYDLPLYRRNSGQYVLHRILEIGETYTCIGDNQFAYEAGLRQEQMIAVVTGFTRGSKEHTVTEWSYRAYCVLWHHTRPARHLWYRVIGKIKRILIKAKARNFLTGQKK